ncbi:hypothetical protein TPA0906_22620 [Streptomyces olivaceus]|nr:hypothetical protein TPA0906_22620 [Streptomyces olivaceus]
MIAKPPRSAPEKDFREPSSRPIGVRAPATTTEVVPFPREAREVREVPDAAAEDMGCDPLFRPAQAEEVNEGLLECTERYPARHRAVGVMARTLRNHLRSAALSPC